jgi:hypothetical protein
MVMRHGGGDLQVHGVQIDAASQALYLQGEELRGDRRSDVNDH